MKNIYTLFWVLTACVFEFDNQGGFGDIPEK